MVRYRPTSIEEEGVFNRAERLKEQHNGLGADALRSAVEDYMKGFITISQIARKWGMSRNGIKPWVKLAEADIKRHDQGIDSLRHV